MSHQSHCFPLALKPNKQTNLHQLSHVHLVLAVQDSSPTCDLESAKACKYTPVQPEMAKSVGSSTSFCSKCFLPEASVYKSTSTWTSSKMFQTGVFKIVSQPSASERRHHCPLRRCAAGRPGKRPERSKQNLKLKDLEVRVQTWSLPACFPMFPRACASLCKPIVVLLKHRTSKSHWLKYEKIDKHILSLLFRSQQAASNQWYWCMSFTSMIVYTIYHWCSNTSSRQTRGYS